MCTIGAKILRPGQEFFLFKNRDFARPYHADALRVNERAFGIMGLEAWNECGASEDIFSGFAFGFNEALGCATAFMRDQRGAANFDRLAQAVVETSASIDEALDCIERAVKMQEYGWCNLVLATVDEVAAIEIQSQVVGVERSTGAVVRTNHPLLLPLFDGALDTDTTVERLDAACAGLENTAAIDDLKALLAAHLPGQPHGICHHGALNTVYSYILHGEADKRTLHIHQGFPCDGRPYHSLPVDWGRIPDCSSYPAARFIPG